MSLTVKAPQLESVKLTSDKKSIPVSKTAKLTVTGGKLENGKPADISQATIQYYSSNSAVASVDSNGVVTANKTGTVN